MSSSGNGGSSIGGARSAAPRGTIFLRVVVVVNVELGKGDAGKEDLRIDAMVEIVRFGGANVGVGGSAASNLEELFAEFRLNLENLADKFRSRE